MVCPDGATLIVMSPVDPDELISSSSLAKSFSLSSLLVSSEVMDVPPEFID